MVAVSLRDCPVRMKFVNLDMTGTSETGQINWTAKFQLDGIPWEFTVTCPPNMNGARLQLEFIFWACVTPEDGVDDDFWSDYTEEQLVWASSTDCERVRAWAEAKAERLDRLKRMH